MRDTVLGKTKTDDPFCWSLPSTPFKKKLKAVKEKGHRIKVFLNLTRKLKALSTKMKRRKTSQKFRK